MASLRFWLRLTVIVVTLLVAVPLHFLWRLLRLPSPWPRRYLGLLARIVGARVQITGTPLSRDVVFVANHLSWIDIPAIAGATGSSFVAMAALRQAPLVGWLSTLNKTLFVDRTDRLGVAAQIDALRDAMRTTRAITIFPEGTTTDGSTLLPFKAALLAVLDPPPPEVRVQPVRIDYGAESSELAWVGDEPGKDHATRVLRRSGHFPVHLTFCEPFDSADYPGRKAIAAEARARIEAVK